MQLSGLHILLTYQCTYECAHCFVWGSPRQRGVLTLEQVRQVLQQAREAGLEAIYFEGGEPFLYYAILVKGVHWASEMGFSVGIVTNAYWATSAADAIEWLQPLAGCVDDLAVSDDLYHCSEGQSDRPRNALAAARQLSIPADVICIDPPEVQGGSLMYRGRASQLALRAVLHPWEGFTTCPHEDLRAPGRVHLDPFGNLHICQGIVIGNLFERPLRQICDEYAAEAHPICAPLLAGGPAALVRRYHLPHASDYADACHLCYEARTRLRSRFPSVLAPDSMYGVVKNQG